MQRDVVFHKHIYFFLFGVLQGNTLNDISANRSTFHIVARKIRRCVEIAISNSLVLYFREEPYTEIMHLRGQLRSVQENARNLRSFLRVVRQVQKSSY